MGEGDSGMIKKCYVLNGKVINIGEWDYQIQQQEVSPPEYDEEGNIVKEAVFEEKIMNPIPEGAIVEERNFDYDSDRGWYEVGTYPEPTAQERLEALEAALLEVVLGG